LQATAPVDGSVRWMAISAVNLLWLIDPHDLQGISASIGRGIPGSQAGTIGRTAPIGAVHRAIDEEGVLSPGESHYRSSSFSKGLDMASTGLDWFGRDCVSEDENKVLSFYTPESAYFWTGQTDLNRMYQMVGDCL